MAYENFNYCPDGEHMRQAPEPNADPVTWPGAYVSSDKGHDIPQRVKEYHEYWAPTVGPQWYQLPRGK